MRRCGRCFKRVEFIETHICRVVAPTAPPRRRSQHGYRAPSRAHMMRRDEYLEKVAAKHGTRSCYQNGCRQSECVDANASYMRERRRRRGV